VVSMTERPLRVVMPVLTYVPGAMGGSETYVRALIDGLQNRDDIELTVLTSRTGAGALGAKSEYVVRAVGGGQSTGARVAAIARGLVSDKHARSLLREADVVHYPFTVPVPTPPKGTPWVQTLLDVQHHDLPGMFSRAERSYRALFYDRPAKRATRVITISDFCRDRITAQLSIPADRVGVAHLGVDAGAFRFQDGPRDEFVLFPATAWPHKNHARLIAAMERVRQTRPALRLVLTGGKRDALGALPAWVEHRGVVSDHELRDLYRSAACLAFPSLYEGFGLPPLEAMASGCPVAAASAGSLPEVCGDAAVMFDAKDLGSIADGIRAVLAGPTELARAGGVRAKLFSWENCVERHVDAYAAAR
jgi:glycosyltransferase involved in cell wall biosynthesis